MTISRRGFMKWVGVGAVTPALVTTAAAKPAESAEVYLRSPRGCDSGPGTPWCPPWMPDIVLALHCRSPMESHSQDAGMRGRAECNEVKYEGYRRAVVPANEDNWLRHQNGSASNRVTIAWPMAAGNGGAVTHVSISCEDGRIWYWMPIFKGPILITGGVSPHYRPGELVVMP